jgi:hypothetical protein
VPKAESASQLASLSRNQLPVFLCVHCDDTWPLTSTSKTPVLAGACGGVGLAAGGVATVGGDAGGVDLPGVAAVAAAGADAGLFVMVSGVFLWCSNFDCEG